MVLDHVHCALMVLDPVHLWYWTLCTDLYHQCSQPGTHRNLAVLDGLWNNILWFSVGCDILFFLHSYAGRNTEPWLSENFFCFVIKHNKQTNKQTNKQQQKLPTLCWIFYTVCRLNLTLHILFNRIYKSCYCTLYKQLYP